MWASDSGTKRGSVPAEGWQWWKIRSSWPAESGCVQVKDSGLKDKEKKKFYIKEFNFWKIFFKASHPGTRMKSWRYWLLSINLKIYFFYWIKKYFIVFALISWMTNVHFFPSMKVKVTATHLWPDYKYMYIVYYICVCMSMRVLYMWTWIKI